MLSSKADNNYNSLTANFSVYKYKSDLKLLK